MPVLLKKGQALALTVTQIQTVIDQLYLIASTRGGIGTMTFEGRTVKYSSLDELNRAIDFWESRLARANNTRPRVMRHNLENFD